jgi:hypothetical protein
LLDPIQKKNSTWPIAWGASRQATHGSPPSFGPRAADERVVLSRARCQETLYLYGIRYSTPIPTRATAGGGIEERKQRGKEGSSLYHFSRPRQPRWLTPATQKAAATSPHEARIHLDGKEGRSGRPQSQLPYLLAFFFPIQIHEVCCTCCLGS